MGKRSTGRKLAMQALYQADISGASIDAIFSETSLSGEFPEETVGFARVLAEGAWGKRQGFDKIIAKFSRDWSMDRMGVVIVSILRLALYELDCEKETPTSVIIDEAVELAKKFGTVEAAKFVNGILGSFVKENKACSRE